MSKKQRIKRPRKLEVPKLPKIPRAKKEPNATCRDCAEPQYVGRERFNAARPRCIRCGGLLDIKPMSRKERDEARLRFEYSRK